MRQTTLRLILAALAAALLGTTAWAEITVYAVDGTKATGTALALSKGQLTLAADSGSAESWALEDIARIVTGVSAAEVPSAGRVDVAGGRLAARVKAFDGDHFTVESGSIGEVKLPVATVVAVVATDSPAAAKAPEGPDKDILLLANGDRLSGTVNGIDENVIRFHSSLGDLQLERGRVAAIWVATPVRGRPTLKQPSVQVALVDGTVAPMDQVEITDDRVNGRLCGVAALSVPVADVVSVEVVGGRLTPLQSLKPVKYEQQSMDILKWDLAEGRNVLGQTMRLRTKDGDEPKAFDQGLGVHGPCRIVYRLDGKYDRFLTLVGIDEAAGQWADANIVVKVDGQEAFRKDHLKWREAAAEVNVNLAGAKELELIVESGEYFDVQDRVDWADARLLRKPSGN